MKQHFGLPTLTSPGVLLIFAVAAAGGICLLGQFTILPHIAAQESSALRQQAIRTEQAARAVLAGQTLAAKRACRAWAHNHEVAALVANGASDTGLARFASENFDRSVIHLAWISRPDGKVISAWAPEAQPALKNHIVEATERLGSPGRIEDTGLLTIGNQVAIVARQAVGDSRQPTGYLWLGRHIDSGILDTLNSAVAGQVVLVAAGELPEGIVGELAGSQAFWSADSNTLAVGWRLQDLSGKRFGYFRADIPVTQVRAQAAAARKMVQIVLALSLGLSVLLIAGTHILISGPVFRLLRRLQRLDTGVGSVDDLTQDLHGEPLVLARRLESAFEKLDSLSKTEQLTGMANRRHFEQVLNAFYHQARRYNRPLSLILLDVDFFKAVNDTGGHKAGDELLKMIAGAIEGVCRKADLPARLGGDEFGILLPETPAANAADVAERIRKAVSELQVPVQGSDMTITASVGIADLNSGEIDSPETMMLLADKAMYAAKQLGRNRICQAHDLDRPPEAQQGKHAEQIDLLRRKVVGLDAHFKEVFISGLEEILEVLAHRDPHMADHAQKTRHYCTVIAQEMGLPDRVVKRVKIAAALHDIGMLAMPDSVLLCDGPLNAEQTACLRQHPLIAVRVMESMEFLEQEIPTVRYHHERFDGKGYPEGITGSMIPLTARILAVADAFDAMTSPRTFRAAKSVQEAMAELRAGAGSQFDPAVIDAIAALVERLGDQFLFSPDPHKAAVEAPWPVELQSPAEK